MLTRPLSSCVSSARLRTEHMARARVKRRRSLRNDLHGIYSQPHCLELCFIEGSPHAWTKSVRPHLTHSAAFPCAFEKLPIDSAGLECRITAVFKDMFMFVDEMHHEDANVSSEQLIHSGVIIRQDRGLSSPLLSFSRLCLLQDRTPFTTGTA